MAPKNPLAESLRRLLHAPGAEPGAVEVEYLHRGGIGDRAIVSGTAIAEVGARAVRLGDGTELPLHRVRELRLRGEVVWRRT